MKTKSFIAALLLTASSAFAQVPSYVPTIGLSGWWSFSGNVNDEIGSGNNGTINNVSFTNDRFGNLNSALLLNGSTNQSILPNAFFTGTQVPSFTIHCVVKANSVSNIPNIWGKTYFWGEVNLGIGNDNSIGISWANSYSGNKYSSIVSNGGIFQTNTWNTIDVVFQNSSGQIYLNGVLVNSSLTWSAQGGALISQSQIESVCNFATDANSNRFGVRNTGGNWGNYLNGAIDEFGIWNRALSQQEITALYNAQTCNSSSNAITADGPTTFCAGNYVNLTSDVVGGTYQWKKNGVNVTSNGTSRTYKATATGSYTCVATCNGTALTSNAIAVSSKTNAFASVTASGAISFCAGDSVTLNATNLGSNYSVQWYRTNVSMENSTNYSQVVKQPGTYKVVTRNLTNGCSRISGSAITTNVNCRIAGDVTSGAVIQENTNVDSRFIDNELSQGVHIYPNPNSGVFSFNYDGEETGDAVLQIINNMGQSIYQSRLTIPEGGFTQDLQLGDNISKGIYIVRLLINNSYHDSKVMVK
jgi:hypothetical protein